MHLAVPLGLSVASMIVATAAAHSVEIVAVRTGLHPGFGRLVFEWSQQIGFDGDLRGSAVVLRFDRPVTTDLSIARAELSEYLKQVSAGGNPRDVRLDLMPGVDARVWTAGDRKVVVDLGFDRSADSGVAVRTGTHQGYDRIVLEWADPIVFEVTRHHPGLRIEFDQPTQIDEQLLRRELPASVLDVHSGVADDHGWLEYGLATGALAKVSNYGDHRRIVIDIVPTVVPMPQLKQAPVLDHGTTYVAAPRPTPTARQEAPARAQRWAAASSPWQTVSDWLAWLVEGLRAVVWGFIGWSAQPAIVQADAAVRRNAPLAPTYVGTPPDMLMPGGHLDGTVDPPTSRQEEFSRAEPSLRTAHAPRRSAETGRALEPPMLDAITAGAMAPQPDVPVPAPPGTHAESSDDPDDNPELEALNRVLVQAGGLLLPTWGIELAPETMYEYQGSSGLLITDLGNGRRTAMSQQARRDTIEAATTLRVGLPWDSQAEIRVPYRFSSEEVSLGGQSQASRNGSGIGDVAVGLSHQILRENKWYPDLLGEVRWKTTTGDDNFEVDEDSLATGSGFNAIGGSLTAVKSYDPMVFFGRLSYEANLPDKKSGIKIDPGDTFSVGIGAILSAGPGTSFRFGISQSFTDEIEVDGDTIAGTDQVSGVLQIGAAAALPNRTLLDISAGVGITEDAPDFIVRASLPYRF